MPSRSSATELSRVLDRSVDPIYVLDARRRIIFANEACAQWTRQSLDELLSAECRYHSMSDETGAVPVAATLCPPPEVFTGHATSVPITFESDGGERSRIVDFVPLIDPDGEVIAVMATARWAKASTTADTLDGSLTSAEQLHARIEAFRRAQRQQYHVDRLIGNSLTIRRVRAQVAALGAGAASVLIVGPQGSGRQHVARAVHHAGHHAASSPLIPLAAPLLGAAFLQTTLRALQRSNGEPLSRPTLLLNDVDHMPAEARGELLLAMRSSEVPLRVISTARQPLLELPGEHRFQPELAAYLSTFVIELPSLSERLEDLPLLAQMLLEECNAAGDKQLAGFAPDALEHLATYSWPGQVDELAEVVRHAHRAAAGPLVRREDLHPRLSLAADAARYPPRVEEPIELERVLAEIERDLIERAIARSKGNKTRAARLLGLTRPRLYRRLVQLGLEAEIVDGVDRI